MALRLPRIGAGRRVHPDDAVDELAAKLADRIGPAVHPYEVAALLESEGLTGEAITEKYGHKDLFSLAEDLYTRVPREFPEPPGAADPWAPDHVRCALRGALFGLPGLAYPLTSGLWFSDGAVAALIVAGLISWAWSQGLAHRAYLRLASGRHEAGRTLLYGAPAGALLAAGAATVLAGPTPAALFAVWQSVYLAAAGVLLVFARERLLLATLVPVIGGAAVLPWVEPGPWVRAGLPLLTAVLVVAVAGRAIRAAVREDPAPGAVRPGPAVSLPYGLFGLGAGVLVMCAGLRHPWAVVVLTLSMGPAEWLLFRYRGLSVAALRKASTPAGFRAKSAAVLGGCLAVYLLPLAPAAYFTGAEIAPLLALAAVLWTALLLQAFGIAWVPAALTLCAAAGVGADACLRPPAGPLVPLLCCTAAAVGLLAWALHRLGRPTAHA
ncbi:hypothetical protein GCM10010329_73450 [Streptomyces spiroverticillatus]|uniref:Integral membrane protein n=2 Tax=Streptomyces finlayi TaxID=67296 RepID=A0A919CED0_9ACTN|nr:hypothetical protein GCM10010329_73450 [Streptomyces spiroverticillatus]GHD14406.1 hypothetical protein GCM10010334_73610 [Streptomyces finlayi]